jgi:hypothetical protein
MADKIVIDGYSQLLRGLKKLAPEVDKNLRKELRGLAAGVASDAKANASWSDRIPPAIGVSVTNKGVGVRVARKRAPHGSLFERGSRGNRGAIRHPVFGSDTWVSQPTRPFLQPAVDSRRDDLLRDAEAALRKAVRQAGLGG